MKTRHLFYVWLSAVCFSVSAFAATPYFPATSIPATLLTPPLAAGSPAWTREIDYIIALQTAAKPETIAKAEAEYKLTTGQVARSMIPALQRETYPATYTLLDRAAAVSNDLMWQDKKHWNTKRPYKSDARVKTLISASDNPSYPSGHATLGFLVAHVMAQLIPEKREAFMTRAGEIGMHRVVGGMHYPHDIAGARELALLAMGGLTQNAEFQRDFAAARAELASRPPAP